MPKLAGKETPGKRLVLGFDGGCSVCGELARQLTDEKPSWDPPSQAAG